MSFSLTADGNTLTWAGAGIDFAGKPTSATTVFTKTDEDAYTWEILDQIVGGEKTPPSEGYKHVRVK